MVGAGKRDPKDVIIISTRLGTIVGLSVLAKFVGNFPIPQARADALTSHQCVTGVISVTPPAFLLWICRWEAWGVEHWDSVKESVTFFPVSHMRKISTLVTETEGAEREIASDWEL